MTAIGLYYSEYSYFHSVDRYRLWGWLAFIALLWFICRNSLGGSRPLWISLLQFSIHRYPLSCYYRKSSFSFYFQFYFLLGPVWDLTHLSLTSLLICIHFYFSLIVRFAFDIYLSVRGKCRESTTGWQWKNEQTIFSFILLYHLKNWSEI